MATTVLGLKTFAASDPVDYNEINDNYNKIDNGVKTAMHGRAAHNLLDNSDFTNPVNQRGATTATLGKYFIDRWNTEPFPSGPSITIDSNGLTLLPTTSSTAGIFQKIPDYEKRKGKIHTFAICVGNEWKCVSFTMGNFGVGYPIHGLYFFSVDNQNILLRNNKSDNPTPITIQRVALYEGAYTADTLPAYVPKDSELEECQLYHREEYVVPVIKVQDATFMIGTVIQMRDMGELKPTITLKKFTRPGVIDVTSFGASDRIDIENLGKGRYLLMNAILLPCQNYEGGFLRFSINADI